MIDVYCLQGKTSPGRGFNFPCLILNTDSWNDYGYVTLFHARWFTAFGKSTALGSTKILQRGTMDTSLRKHFNELSSAYCSLGQNLSYYEEIRALGTGLQQQILRALRDIVASPQIATAFEDEEGFKTSLLRYSEAEQAFRQGGKIVHRSPSATKQIIAFDYSTKHPRANVPHEVSLTFGDNKLLPCRIVAFIGKNATGKTWLLSQLASDISGDKKRRGNFQPHRPSFGRVIAVSYNALDRFRRPPRGEATFSYIYCGIYDRRGMVIPRPKLLARLGKSYVILQEKGIKSLWAKVLTEVFGKAFARSSRISLGSEEFDSSLNRLSSGQMILLAVLTEVLAKIERNSLILYDEPELHLHPNAISALMRGLATILDHFESFAIVATHSPLIIQQIPAAYVRVFTRIENQTFIRELSEESFGENLSVLTESVFQVNATQTTFLAWLKTLPESTSPTRILNSFSKGLSFNAKSQIRTFLAHRREE